MSLFGNKLKKKDGNYYEDSTQEWLPIETIRDGIIVLKDGRYIKVVEVLPVNFYLKSDVEQENIIYYFANYLKIAPDNLQIRVLTQRADISEYIGRLEQFSETEKNEACHNMILDEMEFVQGLSNHVAIKKRFFIIFELAQKGFADKAVSFQDAQRALNDEAYKGMKYLAQCGLEVINISNDSFLIDLFYGIINKYTSQFVKPGDFVDSMLEEVHVFEGMMKNEHDGSRD